MRTPETNCSLCEILTILKKIKISRWGKKKKLFLVILVFLSSQPFVMLRSDKMKPLFSCGVILWTDKFRGFSRPSGWVQSSEMHTNQMTPGSGRVSRKSHMKKWDQKIKIIVTYDRKTLAICWCINIPKAGIKFLLPFISLLHHKQEIFVATRCMSCQC